MKLEQLANKKILIAGFGVEGKSAYDFLKTHFPNQVIDITDKKDGDNYLDKQKEYDLVIKSPGIHKSLIKIPYTTPTNLFFGHVQGTTIGVTGSKGKSTTASIIFSILKEAGKKVHLVGNITHKMDPIGIPMLTELLLSNTPEDIWVCELSSYQLDDITYSPNISVMTSFFPEHLDYHKNIEEYWRAKKNIVAFAKKSDIFVYNPSYPRIEELAKTVTSKAIPFVETLPFPESSIPIPGIHNVANVKGAVTVAKLFTIPDDTITQGVQAFKGLPHRIEYVGTFNDISFFDDAIATTPEATMQALKTVKDVETIFLGGQDRGYDFKELAKLIAEKDIENIVLFPDSGETIFKEIQKFTNKKFNVLRTKDMKEAVTFAYKNTKKEKSVLLSTSSPSYSVWSGFEEKGNLFKKFVRELA